MKKLALFCTLLSLGLFVAGCGDTSKPKASTPSTVNTPTNQAPMGGPSDTTTTTPTDSDMPGDSTSTPADGTSPDGDKPEGDTSVDDGATDKGALDDNK